MFEVAEPLNTIEGTADVVFVARPLRRRGSTIHRSLVQWARNGLNADGPSGRVASPVEARAHARINGVLRNHQ